MSLETWQHLHFASGGLRDKAKRAMMGKAGGNLGNDNFIARTTGSCNFIKIIGAESCSSLSSFAEYKATFIVVLVITDKGQ